VQGSPLSCAPKHAAAQRREIRRPLLNEIRKVVGRSSRAREDANISSDNGEEFAGNSTNSPLIRRKGWRARNAVASDRRRVRTENAKCAWAFTNLHLLRVIR